MSYYSLITANRASSLLFSYLTSRDNGAYLIPANVCPVIPMTFKLANVDFKFADIDSKTLCLNKRDCFEFARKCGGKGGIVYVRTYGCLDDEESFFSELKREYPSFTIIDDRCLCLPQLSMERTSANMILFSTGYAKQVDLGEGGYCFINNDEFFSLNTNLPFKGDDLNTYCSRSFETRTPLNDKTLYWLEVKSLSFNNDNYISMIKDRIDERNNQRAIINSIYKSHIPAKLRFNDKFQGWRFNIKVNPEFKSLLLQTLFDNNLFASSHYKPVNKLFNGDRFSHANDLSDTVVNLFNDFHYTEEMAFQTTEIIKKVVSIL